jgi:predicted Zn-ribbon and HTH transcriptional regulator
LRRQHTEESRKKIREAITLKNLTRTNEENAELTRRRAERKLPTLVPAECFHCGRNFDRRRVKESKYCSKECRAHYTGGYRPGSGRSKSGWYRGIWCDSTYELAFVVYHLDHGSQIERNQGSWPYTDENGIERRYFPDFVVDGVLYEIKGYMSARDVLKPENVQVTLVNGPEENEPYIKYAASTYGIARNKLWTLYEDAPTYEHTCGQCGVTFTAHDKERTYCSQNCAGKNLAANRDKYRGKK